jgi:hypothetical protein
MSFLSFVCLVVANSPPGTYPGSKAAKTFLQAMCSESRPWVCGDQFAALEPTCKELSVSADTVDPDATVEIPPEELPEPPEQPREPDEPDEDPWRDPEAPPWERPGVQPTPEPSLPDEPEPDRLDQSRAAARAAAPMNLFRFV